ncbi:MAG: cell wall-associated hydrolase, invasion-associated protein [Actinomycetia bacterium]|nr:cell wall-associated hydrolase, invasion-associated protein [Actinomycetes bacterium]
MRASPPPRRAFSRIARWPLIISLLLLAFPATVSTSASASPISDKKAEAARLAQQIAANGDRIAALGEAFNGATYELQQTDAAIAEAQRRTDAARKHTSELLGRVKSVALQIYSHAGSSSALSALNVSSANDFALRMKYSNVSAQRDQDAISRLNSARQDLAVMQKALDRRRGEAVKNRNAIAAARQQIEAANAQAQQLQAQVKGQLATLVAQEQARQAAAAKAAALAQIQAARAQAQQSRASAGSVSSGVDPSAVGGGNFPNAPAPSGGAAAAIAYARAQLGKPYVYAATGPDAFDCSGLTMMAWAQGGVSMPHYSGAQYSMFPHVSWDQLQPGDLVFKGPGGSEHVAMYIGGGMQIAATHTGDFVRIQPLMSGSSGAVRPG